MIVLPPDAPVTLALDPRALIGVTKDWLLSDGTAPLGVAPEIASATTPKLSTRPSAP